MVCEKCGLKPAKAGWRFCSQSCQRSFVASKPRHATRNRVAKTCETCGEPFEVPRYREPEARYCSNACYHVGKRESLRGPANPSWKGGVSTNYYLRIVTKDECADCGGRRGLDVHHLDQNRSNNTRENLIVLCRSCHKKRHYAISRAAAAQPQP